ncbi:RIIa domain-containing protein 1 [Microcaecilia unicolor]|uniref:RIIa domain-containing protein 1 n=1 Tax=Microcaecilia unicolor TaxID=1415580 RepID=A0A6P7XXK6_9AMPH|nr:RIIa domain-containing protein 1 [Microcaecilia unicolor]
MEAPDREALNRDQGEKLRELQIKSRVENEKYLRSHPEVELLLTGFIREVLLKRPQNICEFAADHFTDPELPEKIQEKIIDKEQQSRKQWGGLR